MKLFKYLMLVIATVGVSTSLVFAAEGESHEGSRSGSPGRDSSRHDEELNEIDFDALRDYLRSKRDIELEEKDTELSISGDVRFEWRHLTERENGVRLRGKGGRDAITHKLWIPPVPKNDFDIEFNLTFAYKTERSWTVAQVKFDNPAGVDNFASCSDDPQGVHGSGECNRLCLKKAYMGYSIYNQDKTHFDIELGRRKLSDVFDSEIQFLSRFDGFVLKFATPLKQGGLFYWNTAAFIIDERSSYFGYVSEVGTLDFANSGFDLKYSFIHWSQKSENRCFEYNPFGLRYQISQFTLAYNFFPMICGVEEPAQIYGAFLLNHARSNNNLGGYIAFALGEVEGEGDWALDIQYQLVGAYAVSDGDVSGVGRGNVMDTTITDENGLKRGNANFRGWKIDFLYAITDNLTIDATLESSRALNRHIGGPHKYSKMELEAIFAF